MDVSGHNHGLRASPAWQSYRRAFNNFRNAVRAVQNLSGGNLDKSTLDAAVLTMQQAHEDYRSARDILAREMMPSGKRGFLRRESTWNQEGVKEIAELLWELEGRPDGTALDDWYRAESIVRRTSAGPTRQERKSQECASAVCAS